MQPSLRRRVGGPVDRQFEPKRLRSSWSWVDDGRHEFYCKCGVGHPASWKPDGVHGCCGCCSSPDFPGRAPVVGCLALCGVGSLGLVTSPEKVNWRYPNGVTREVYVGTTIWAPSGRVSYGDPWTSANPCVVGTILDLVPGETLHDLVRRLTPEGWTVEQ